MLLQMLTGQIHTEVLTVIPLPQAIADPVHHTEVQEIILFLQGVTQHQVHIVLHLPEAADRLTAAEHHPGVLPGAPPQADLIQVDLQVVLQVVHQVVLQAEDILQEVVEGDSQ